MKKYFKTMYMSMTEKTNSGVLYLLPNIIVKVVYFLPLVFMWRVVMQDGNDPSMTLQQMMSYTFISTILADQLQVRTAASEWLGDGVLIKLFSRPMSVIFQLIAQTVGGWLPSLMFYSLPIAVIAPFLGVSLIPATLWFFPSLLLCISLGFAIDFVFSCLVIRMRGITWLVYVIRSAITAVFAGSVIPFKLMPEFLQEIMVYQPFGSLAGAPLSLAAGISSPIDIIPIQLFWNVIIWAAALILMANSREKIASYGG